MVECRRFVVGMLMVYVTVSEISVLSVSRLHLGFSARGSVDHDCWTFTCFVRSHKHLDWFWNDMRICKNSEVITTSGNLAAILNFWHTSTSHKIGNTTTENLDPKT